MDGCQAVTFLDIVGIFLEYGPYLPSSYETRSRSDAPVMSRSTPAGREYITGKACVCVCAFCALCVLCVLCVFCMMMSL